ncbi:HemK2/MTQ2 family protein methyltransferase [Nocardia sp. NPDC050717]|uniref:HemK2/MTQ2 family protein methyltransferase n=1 Tax=Nocardia sp. NPDC050717 TaxID=3157221 RepID=UPI0034030899
MVFRIPGVYRPQADTWLLAETLRQAPLPRGGSVLDVCAGTGILGCTAAGLLGAQLTAVDISRRALASAWLNCRARGVPVRLVHGGFESARALPRFDVVVANPPYVPAPGTPSRGRARAWDAGPDGRSVLDRLCATLPDLLTERGVALIVHSALSDAERTVTQLRAGLAGASVVARARVAFGPVLRSRSVWLAERGLIETSQRTEELVVIRAEREPSVELALP